MTDGVWSYRPKTKTRQSRLAMTRGPSGLSYGGRRVWDEPASEITYDWDKDWLLGNIWNLAIAYRLLPHTAEPCLEDEVQTWVIACRVYDPRQSSGWRPAWLQVVQDASNRSSVPSFTSPEWLLVEDTNWKAAAFILAVIENEAKTRPEAMLIRDMLVAPSLDMAGCDEGRFRFTPKG